jgi:hypothetical protein
MNNEIEQIKKDIEYIKERNKKVEKDKSWEVSLERKILISILTYIIVLIFFKIVKIPRPFVNAIVPTIGFLLSTLSLSFAKKLYTK